MFSLFLAIVASIFIIVIFKYFEILEIPTFPSIVVNYWVCLVCGLLVGGYTGSVNDLLAEEWLPFAGLMSLLFIGGFYLIALATQKVGLAPASVANKVSMVVPVVVAFMIYDNEITALKVIGICGAVASVFLVSAKANENWDHIRANLKLPIAVFLVGGILETFLNYLQRFYLDNDDLAIFLALAFGSAGLIGTFILLFQRRKVGWRILLGGIALGIPNYASLYFLLKALENSGLESSQVFPINSIGIVGLAALAGWIFFREKLSRTNLVGLSLALVSILAITY